MTKEYKTYNDFEVGKAILEFCTDGELLTESKAKSYMSRTKILTESHTVDDEILFESADPVETMTIKEQSIRINWKTFYAVFTDVRTYPTLFDVYAALGFDTSRFEAAGEARGGFLNLMRTVLAQTNKKFTERHDRPDLGGWARRAKGWSPTGVLRRQFEENGYDSDTVFGEEGSQVPLADPSGVNGGTKNKKTQTVTLFNNLNDDNILPGDLYADFTKIPKSNWNSFIKFWNRRRSSVAHDTSLFGKEWKKLFLFGYQVQRNLFFEVWYNSIDSSFSIHDSRGAELTRRSPTVSEAVRKLFNHVLQVSRNDVDYDSASFNKATQLSIARAAARGMAGDQRMADLIKKENDREAKIHKDAADAKEKSDKKKKMYMDFAKDKASGAAAAAKNYAKNKGEEALDAYRDITKDTESVYNNPNWKKPSERAAEREDEREGSTYDGEYEVEVETNNRRIETSADRAERYALTMKSRSNTTKQSETPPVINMGSDASSKNKAYQSALSAYQNERDKKQSETNLMLKNPAKKDNRGGETATEKELKNIQSKKQHDKAVKGKTSTKEPKAKKNKNAVGSLFGDSKVTIDQYDKEDSSGFRKPMTAAEKRALEQDFRLTDDDAYDDDAFAAKMDQISGLNEAYGMVPYDEQAEIADEIQSELSDETRDSIYQSKVEDIRRIATARNFTAGGFKDAIAADIIETYNETRAPRRGKLRWLEQRFLKGRPDLLLLPTDVRTVFNKAKEALLGGAFRADFVLGYTIGDRVDFEIWYVTEPNPEFNWLSAEVFKSNTSTPKFISSFYVYDITGQRLIRKYIPYYRNAIQVLSQKLFALV